MRTTGPRLILGGGSAAAVDESAIRPKLVSRCARENEGFSKFFDASLKSFGRESPGSRSRRLAKLLAGMTLLQFGKVQGQIGNQVVLQEVMLGKINQRLVDGVRLEPGPF